MLRDGDVSMKPATRILLYLVSLPNDLLIAWPIVLLIHLLWGTRLYWEDGALASIRRPGSWIDKRWRFSTTLGHGISYHSNHRGLGDDPKTAVRVHEHVHVEQSEAAMLGSFVTACLLYGVLGVGWWWLALLVWSLGNVLFAVAGWVTAILRGEDAYRGAHFEEAAYAVDAPHRDRVP